jgi:hypothetical protein
LKPKSYSIKDRRKDRFPAVFVIKNPFFNLKIHLWWRKNQDKSPFLPLGWRFFSNVARPKWRVKSEGNDGFEKVFGVFNKIFNIKKEILFGIYWFKFYHNLKNQRNSKKIKENQYFNTIFKLKNQKFFSLFKLTRLLWFRKNQPQDIEKVTIL